MLFLLGAATAVVAIVWLVAFFLPSACYYPTIARKRDKSYAALRDDPRNESLEKRLEQDEEEFNRIQRRNMMHLLISGLIGVLAFFFFLLNAVMEVPRPPP